MPNLSADSFGPPVWATFHLLAAAYEPAKAKQYFGFFKSMSQVLPCEECRQHMRTFLNDEGFYNENVFRTRASMELFIYDLHSKVTKLKGGSVDTVPSFVEVQRKYRSTCSDKGKNKNECKEGCSMSKAPRCRVVFE